MTSIVIPAHNEARVIERCLASMLEGALPGEFEVVVVCNGCSDDTANLARRFGGRVRVVETDIGSKIHALNLGDQNVTAFPRFYVDADVQLSAQAIRDVASLLGDDSPVVVAAPRAVVAYDDRSWAVRAFYRVWTRLPYFTEDMVGSGVYAFSRSGRARFGAFPQVTADDEYARHIAAPHERRASSGSTFTIHPPRNVNGLLKIMTRARAASHEFRRDYPHMQVHGNTSASRSLRIIASTPSMWPSAPVYLGLMYLAQRRARAKLRARAEKVWERDETSRQ